MSRPVVVARRTPMATTAGALWRWHAAPGAFERLRPPWEQVEILARSGDALTEGLQVTLRLRRGPIALRWVLRHEAVEPGVGFDDVQLAGSQELASVSAVVTYAGLSAQDEPLRSMNNRLSWVLKTSGHVLRVVHEHSSAPIGFDDMKAILVRAPKA